MGPPWWLNGKESACQLQEIQETRVQCVGGKDPLEKEMVTHSTNLAWEIPRTEKGGGLQSMGLKRDGHDIVTKQ